ncbi:MAG: hypothetical protein AB7D07_02865 [Desulfovibrionaceae bacterium]
MDYYQRKAQVEAMIHQAQPPREVTRYFLVIKEVFAHNRADLALTLCDAFVLSRRAPGQDAGGRAAPDHDGGAERNVLEAIRVALACSHIPPGQTVQLAVAWIHFSRS